MEAQYASSWCVITFPKCHSFTGPRLKCFPLLALEESHSCRHLGYRTEATGRWAEAMLGDYLVTKKFPGMLVVKGRETQHQWCPGYLHNKFTLEARLTPPGLAKLSLILLQGIHWKHLKLLSNLIKLLPYSHCNYWLIFSHLSLKKAPLVTLM